MAQIETWYNQDLKQPVKVHYLHGNVFSQDNQGNILGVNVFDDGVPASLSGTVNAYIIRSDGATVPATGSFSENKASVVLPEAAYAIPGIISIVLKLTTGSVVVTLLAVVATVYTSITSTAVDPGTIIPSIEDLIEEIQEAIGLIPADYSDLTVAVANDYRNQQEAGKTTVCIPIGEVKTNTVITKGTGVDRAGGGTGNNFVTKGFIPVPDGIFSVISKSVSFYIAGYGANFQWMADINDETAAHSAGELLIDNTIYGFSYIRIGLYSSTGYTEAKYNALEVLYYTDSVQKSKNFIDGQRLGAKTVNTSSGVSTINYSSVRIGPDKFVKAEKNIQIVRDGNTSHNWRYLLILAKNPSNGDVSAEQVTNDWNISTQAAYGTIIPKGCYYWLGYSFGTDNIVNVNEAINNAPSYIHINELEENEAGYYSFGANYDVSFTSLARVGVPDKKYADTDLFIVSNEEDIVFSLKLYADGEWDSPAWTGHYSVRYAYIPKGTWYRYNVGKSDGSVISQEEIESVFDKVRVYTNWNSNADIFKFVFGLQTDLSSVRRRISELESNAVPAYYESHIATKAQAINTLKPTNGSQFMFITDLHINGYGDNEMNAKPLINYICRNTMAKMLFNGGDLFNSGYGMSSAEALNQIQKCIIYTQPDDCDGVQYVAMGNHDTGVDYIGGQEYGPSITASQFLSACGNNSKRSAITFDPNSDACFYFDLDGIRYIVSDFGIDTYTEESIGNTFLFVSKAVKSASGPIVIIQHVLWNTVDEDPSFRPYRLQQLQNIVDACNSRGTCQYGDGAEYLVDFADSTGRVCCIIGGHLHTDRYSSTPGGVPIIATTTDNWKAEASITSASRANAAGTVNEQAFDVFTLDLDNNKLYATRIGFGSDRTFDIPSVT